MSSLPALQALIQEKYGEEMAGLDPDTSMREKGFDSLALVEFVFAIEDHFHIVLPDDDPDIDTLAQLSAVVDRVLAEKAAGPAAPEPAVGGPAAVDATAQPGVAEASPEPQIEKPVGT